MIVRFVQAGGLSTVEGLGLEAAEFSAPMAYPVIYTLGIFLFMPRMLLPTLGAAVYRA